MTFLYLTVKGSLGLVVNCKCLLVVAFDSDVSALSPPYLCAWCSIHGFYTTGSAPGGLNLLFQRLKFQQRHTEIERGPKKDLQCLLNKIQTHSRARFDRSLARITCAWVCLMCFPSHGGAAKTITQDEGIFLWEASQCTRACWHFTRWHQTGGSVCFPAFRHTIIQEGENTDCFFFFSFLLRVLAATAYRGPIGC